MPAGAAHAVDLIEPAAGTGNAALSPVSLGLRILLASAVIALLCVCAGRPGHVAGELPAEPRIATPFVPSTRAVPAPPPVAAAHFDLAEPGIDPVRVSARIDPRTGQREDALTRGDVAAIEAVAVRVTLTRGASRHPAPTLFVLMARRAAGGPAVDRPALSVLRTGARGQILTKFGAVETLDVTFSGFAPRTCTGFVTRDTDFQLDGWFCAPLGHPPEPQALVCLIDALRLVDLADPETTAAFVRASPAERGCLAATGAEAAGRTGSLAPSARNKK